MKSLGIVAEDVCEDSIKRECIEGIISAALSAVDPLECVARYVKRNGTLLIVDKETFDLDQYRKIFVVAIGKAALPMTQALAGALGESLSEGFVIAKHLPEGDKYELPGSIQVHLGSHPVPDENSVQSSEKLEEFLKKCNQDDLVLCMISGGGSALATLPVNGISLADLQETTRELLACGAEIQEMNAIRKHLDRIKGGGLAEMVLPAQLVTLVLSDVVGNPLDVIASGPTVPDTSTFSDAMTILEKYQLRERLPDSVWAVLESGSRGASAETPKEGHVCFSKSVTILVGSNYHAAAAAIRHAQEEGMNTLLLTTYLRGEARYAGRFLAGIATQVDQSGEPLDTPACIVAGGETTVVITGDGLGGRNMEMALGAVAEMSGMADAYLVTLATDGEDGPTDAAGAVVSGRTFSLATEKGLSPDAYLTSNDSYHFFEALDSLIKIGPTGTNVNDLAFLFVF